ncbi:MULTISPECIES: hypothetical protein [Pseudomonas syringae group]|uniref:Uncharacterized protein n=2 Tax=Pseudomonas syringae group TaxID=136849 RepID=A0A2K4WZZ1_PSESX|nr:MULTISPECIES: hypothetical protein [Pseudomonas syringae group]AVB13418.1 hypothetical protein BKM19_007225 [Pseudomonas amygdali pv. morsprunorum]KWS51279.1 hypothetical protein AL056_12060 [Pseudomonas amygdali pv. morsprunorum]KWS69710.1 hypothetical protein AL054_18395 [Pseudomonas amygdali pv. morsprunorum]MBI6729765.1 hypothetical protein [Pseudomonas amygdali]MBI6814690.1 hypothetical protein [Pseudomonas amygdali]
MNLYAEHPALQGLSTEQLAELALYGLRYRALGAADVDFSDPSRLDVYWTGERLAKKAVKDALKAARARNALAEHRSSEAGGVLQTLCNCGVIDQKTYMAQHQLLLDRHR